MTYRRTEKGQTLPLVALSLVVLMVAAALSVDIGSLAATNRRLQAVADLAAIDGARVLTDAPCLNPLTGPPTQEDVVNAAVVASAERNGFVIGGQKELLIKLGTLGAPGADGRPTFTPMILCTPLARPDAVQVGARDLTTFGFAGVIGQNGRTSLRESIAGSGFSPVVTPSTTTTTTPPPPTTTPPVPLALGGFSIGSSLANLDTANSPVLNSVLAGMVCRGAAGCSFSTSLVSYNGLANTRVTLGQLQAALTVGSVTQLLDAQLSARDLYLLTAKALGCTAIAGCSSTAAVTLLNMATGSVASTTKFRLGDMILVATGGEAAAAAASFDVLGLVTGSAQVINSNNLITVPVTTVYIPGGTSTALKIKVIEGPKTYIGPPNIPCSAGPPVTGSCVFTSQVNVDVVQQVDLLGIPVLGLGALLSNVASVTGTLPIKVSAGSAKGKLTAVNCAPLSEVVVVDTSGATTTIGDTNAANKFLNVNIPVLLGGVNVVGLNLSGTSSVSGVNGNTLTFDYPNDFLPNAAAAKHVGGTNLNVQGTGLTTNVALLEGITVGLDTAALTSQLTGAGGLITTLDKAVISPVLRALGVDVGGADVWAVGIPSCPSAPPPVTTTTAPVTTTTTRPPVIAG